MTAGQRNGWSRNAYIPVYLNEQLEFIQAILLVENIERRINESGFCYDTSAFMYVSRWSIVLCYYLGHVPIMQTVGFRNGLLSRITNYRQIYWTGAWYDYLWIYPGKFANWAIIKMMRQSTQTIGFYQEDGSTTTLGKNNNKRTYSNCLQIFCHLNGESLYVSIRNPMFIESPWLE